MSAAEQLPPQGPGSAVFNPVQRKARCQIPSVSPQPSCASKGSLLRAGLMSPCLPGWAVPESVPGYLRRDI